MPIADGVRWRELESTRQRIVENVNGKIVADFEAGGRTMIFDLESYPDIAAKQSPETRWARRDISAQLTFLSNPHLTDRKKPDKNQTTSNEHQEAVEESKIGVGDFDVTYILMRPMLGFIFGFSSTVCGYLITASRV